MRPVLALVIASLVVSAGPAAALNPQPLPPKRFTAAKKFEGVRLNPQPLPPKARLGTVNRYDRVQLNPQPLPPKSTLRLKGVSR